MNFGQKLKKLREERGVSQQELAKRLGYKSNSYIFDIERGSFIPSDDKLKRLAKALAVPSFRIKEILFESKLESLGIKDRHYISILKDYPHLSKEDKKAIMEAYHKRKRETRR